MSHSEIFERDGYVVIPEILSSAHCAELLREILEATRVQPPTVIKEPKFRSHIPLPMTAVVSDAVALCVEHAHSILSPFLKNEQELVELSSITVYPNAEEQQLHRDEANDGHYLASVFINLAETEAIAGALLVVPGSHHLEEGGSGETIAIEVPQGSAVVMNSKLLHAGGGNRTLDRMRSVFYFTMGERGLYGPPYSILNEVSAQRMSLDELQPRLGLRRTGLSAEARPQLMPCSELLLPLSSDSEELILIRNASITRRRRLAESEEYLLDVMQRIECHPRELTVRDLAHLSECAEASLLTVLEELARDGWICW